MAGMPKRRGKRGPRKGMRPRKNPSVEYAQEHAEWALSALRAGEYEEAEDNLVAVLRMLR